MNIAKVVICGCNVCMHADTAFKNFTRSCFMKFLTKHYMIQ